MQKAVMTTSVLCDRCGQMFQASESFRNQCPACLFAQALPDVNDGADQSNMRFSPPRIDELEPLFPQLQIHELIGVGGMSAVYKGTQNSLGRIVAIKILPQEVAASHGGLERFQREARMLARLNHSNIVQIHDAGQAGAWCYLIMEFVSGPNLRQLLGDSHLTSAQVLRIAGAICDGLKYAHDQGVVHRDIKPENVLLDSEGRVKLVDFGLAKLFGDAASGRSATKTGQVVGTPHYLAPEQLETPNEVDHRADVYSLGVLIYEMLTGELPLGHFEPPSRRAGSDPALDEVILDAMARDRRQRLQNVQELQSRMALSSAKKERFNRVPAKSMPRFFVSWNRIQELTLSACSLFAGIVGLIGVLMAIVVAIDLPRSQHSLPGAPEHAVAHPAAPPSVLLAAGLIGLLLSLVFARINVSSLSQWNQLAWTQYASLPALLTGYTALGLALLAGPALAIFLMGCFPLLTLQPTWSIYGRLFTEADRTSFTTPYWMRTYAVSLIGASLWCAVFALFQSKYPHFIKGIFHPTSDQTIGTLFRMAGLAAAAIVLPVGLALLLA